MGLLNLRYKETQHQNSYDIIPDFRGQAEKLARLLDNRQRVMKSREDAIAVLDELAALPATETPVIEDLLAACPALRTCEWVNRYGPADEWRTIAVRYSTTTLSWLIRVLVTAERELKWLGGSVAAPIWLFESYQQRPDGDADQLAAWIFDHRGNDYLPFGSMTTARTVAEWRSEQARKPAHRPAHEERHGQLIDAKIAALARATGESSGAPAGAPRAKAADRTPPRGNHSHAPPRTPRPSCRRQSGATRRASRESHHTLS